MISNKKVEIGAEDSPLSKSIQFTKSLKLNHRQNSFSFDFSALNLTAPDQVQYAFMLENFEVSWNFVGKERKAVYRNIPSGNYIFKLKATNIEGEWLDNEKQIEIKILPPWWLTKIAFASYFILLLALLAVSRNIFMKYHQLQNNLKVERKINEIKLRFFTNISHEIRTPLTLILGPLDDLRRIKDLPASIKEPLELMNRNGKRMLRLINQLLDFRKIQNQKMKLKIQKVEVTTFVNGICQNFVELARQKNIQFTFPEKGKGVTAWFDWEKMDSVFLNILSNAFKFTPAGKSITVEVYTEPGLVAIKITDTGKGIRKEDLPLIFERYASFDQVDVNFNGTGIGLGFANELVKLHKGDITVKSDLEHGSTFIIKIPLGTEHFSPNEIIVLDGGKDTLPPSIDYDLDDIMPKTNKDAINSQKNTVLIVEDNMEVSNYISGILSNTYNIIMATNGQEGIDKVHKIPP